MVSLWPFRSGEDAASFEKTLSTLASKIQKAGARNDVLRQRSRRVRVMWTLYAGFAYILAALMLIFVTGWKNWRATEITFIAGGPVIIYLIRTAMTTYYEYRISNTQTYLSSLQKERDVTIERLKAATKYNSTQQLLEKYGSPPKSKDSPPPAKRRVSGEPQKPQQPPSPRTGIAPPPTANILRQGSQPSTPHRPPTAPGTPQGPPLAQAIGASASPGEEFAPNAFTAADLTKQYSASAPSTFTQTHWYDRILDALLGEDETQPKNRVALICTECRLVNGQAPPGARSPEDIGRWRCGGCRAWNGKDKVMEDDVAGLVENWESERRAREEEMGEVAKTKDTGRDAHSGGVDSNSEAGDLEEANEEETRPLAKPKKKGKGKK